MRTREDQSRRLTAFFIVVAVHVAVLWWLALTREVMQIEDYPPFEVALIEPAPAIPSPRAGGNAASAPSVVHIPPPEVVSPFPDAFIAPWKPAAEQPPIVVGAAPEPVVAPAPALGTSDHGAGVGDGQGDGVGSGRGSGNPRWLRELTEDEMLAFYPPRAARRGLSGTVVLTCRIRADTTVDRCRPLSEYPTGESFGRAAVRASALWRIRPRVENGRPVDGRREHITVPFRWRQGQGVGQGEGTGAETGR